MSLAFADDNQLRRHDQQGKAISMASKYGFAQGLKELRFLFCQTSDHSAATR